MTKQKMSKALQSQIKLSKIFKNISNKQKISPSNPTYGAVSTITTAPVAIGNSIRGAQSQVVQTARGVRVLGRDFGFAITATGSTSESDWTLVGGMPLTPAALPSTILRNYTQMYAEFQIKSITMHYITSSPTSSVGDVLFYFNKNRDSSLPDCTSSSFLPFVLSDPHTIIGPQWTNHSAMIIPAPSFRTTDYGMTTNGYDQSAGEVFIYSKTSTTNSPGYVLFDYDIEFRELSVNPRAGFLPVARAQYNPIAFGLTTTAKTIGDGFAGGVQNNSITNTSSALPSGTAIGDIFKCILDPTNSVIVNAAWTNCTINNLIRQEAGNTVVINDGFTCYARVTATNTLSLAPSLSQALNGYYYQFGVTGTLTFTLCAQISLVAFTNSELQSAY